MTSRDVVQCARHFQRPERLPVFFSSLGVDDGVWVAWNQTGTDDAAWSTYRWPDGVVCDNGDVLFPGDPPIEHTIRTQIVCLGEARALWWTRDNATGTPSWQHPMPEVKFENALRWE